MFGSRRRHELARRVEHLEAAAGVAPPAPTAATVAGRDSFPLGGGPWWTSMVDRTAAMSVPTLAYIRGQLAGGVASMPLERYRQSLDPAGQLVATKLPPGWCARPDPAPNISPSLFWSWLIDDLFFYGQCTLVVLARDADGWPVAFRRVLPGQPVYAPTLLAFGTWWPADVAYMGVEVPVEDQVVISGPHDGICNYGGQTIMAALNLETNAATSAAEPLPNINLHQTAGEPLSPDAAAALVNSWKAARQSGATAYTPQNLDAVPLGFSAADQQMVEARQYMATQLARMAGVNPTLVSAAMGSSSSYVYTNQADYRHAFLDDVLDTYLRAIEGRLSANDVTPRGQYLQFDRDAFTTLALVERVQIMLGALKSGADPAALNRIAEALDLDLELPVADDATPAPPPAPTPAPEPTPQMPATPASTPA